MSFLNTIFVTVIHLLQLPMPSELLNEEAIRTSDVKLVISPQQLKFSSEVQLKCIVQGPVSDSTIITWSYNGDYADFEAVQKVSAFQLNKTLDAENMGIKHLNVE